MLCADQGAAKGLWPRVRAVKGSRSCVHRLVRICLRPTSHDLCCTAKICRICKDLAPRVNASAKHIGSAGSEVASVIWIAFALRGCRDHQVGRRSGKNLDGVSRGVAGITTA
jgi:hypothetical protein